MLPVESALTQAWSLVFEVQFLKLFFFSSLFSLNKLSPPGCRRDATASTKQSWGGKTVVFTALFLKKFSSCRRGRGELPADLLWHTSCSIIASKYCFFEKSKVDTRLSVLLFVCRLLFGSLELLLKPISLLGRGFPLHLCSLTASHAVLNLQEQLLVGLQHPLIVPLGVHQKRALVACRSTHRFVDDIINNNTNNIENKTRKGPNVGTRSFFSQKDDACWPFVNSNARAHTQTHIVVWVC